MRRITYTVLRMSMRLWALILIALTGCQLTVDALANGEPGMPLPTQAIAAMVPPSATPIIPQTYTPLPPTIPLTKAPTIERGTAVATDTAVPLPTYTPVTPSATPTATPTSTPAVFPTATPVIKPINQYAYHEVIPYQAFPVPNNNNGWGMHWIANTSQEHGVIDRFVPELVQMNIKWVIFLNDGTDIRSNDYLVERLVANGIMPVMRLYRSAILPYEGDIVGMVRHYRAKGVYYYQIYNEPNVNIENGQGFANPNQYAIAWAAAARQVISGGGLPGIGAFSPGGAYNHYDFLDRTLRALEYNNDLHLLNHAWLSVHNYHGTRPLDDPDGFFLYRKYDEIVRSHLGRSLPIVGTEAGSYSNDARVERDLIAWQYSYMLNSREPYYLAFSYWLLTNADGGHWDNRWEWQALFSGGKPHLAVTDFFYRYGR